MKYFFSIYVVLLLGFTSVYANNLKDNVLISLNSLSNQSDFNNTDAIRNSHDLDYKTFHTTLEKDVAEIRGTDNEVVEEEETISSKRDLITSVYFSSVLYAEQLGCLCNNIKKRLPQGEFFVYFLSNSFQITYCVFII